MHSRKRGTRTTTTRVSGIFACLVIVGFLWTTWMAWTLWSLSGTSSKYVGQKESVKGLIELRRQAYLTRHELGLSPLQKSEKTSLRSPVLSREISPVKMPTSSPLPSTNFPVTITEQVSRIEKKLAENTADEEKAMDERAVGMVNPAIVVLTHNRVQELTELILALKKLPDSSFFKIYVSCDYPPVADAVQNALDGLVDEVWITSSKSGSNLIKIGDHFNFALHTGFEKNGHSHLIMLEDDLMPAPDFLTFFRSAAWLLDADPHLFCISAWNDNGQDVHAHNMSRFFRTSFFPGLGWMTTQQFWKEHLKINWPTAATTGWDHWIRVSGVVEGYDCVFPEVSRVKHISSKGTNVKRKDEVLWFGKQAFSTMEGSADTKPKLYGDLSYLLRDKYFQSVKKLVSSAVRLKGNKWPGGTEPNLVTSNYLIIYEREKYKPLAAANRLWRTEPRGMFEGVTIISNKDPQGNAVNVLFAERREARSFLLATERVDRHVNLTPVLGDRGEDCAATCSKRRMSCAQEQFFYVNKCSVMSRVSDCRKGCNNQIGGELPCFVADSSQPTFGQCLISYLESSSCLAKHRSTQRICPCVPNTKSK